MDLSIIESIERRLAGPLPGIEAQSHMAPVDHRTYLTPGPDHKIASVLLLLYPKSGKWNICYIRRSSKNSSDRHAGQISFPGGKLEQSDQSLQEFPKSSRYCKCKNIS